MQTRNWAFKSCAEADGGEVKMLHFLHSGFWFEWLDMHCQTVEFTAPRTKIFNCVVFNNTASGRTFCLRVHQSGGVVHGFRVEAIAAGDAKDVFGRAQIRLHAGDKIELYASNEQLGLLICGVEDGV
jgi:hypothetical protein